MRTWLNRVAWYCLMFALVCGAHELIHAGHGIFGGMVAGGAFVVAEGLIRGRMADVQ